MLFALRHEVFENRPQYVKLSRAVPFVNASMTKAQMLSLYFNRRYNVSRALVDANHCDTHMLEITARGHIDTRNCGPDAQRFGGLYGCRAGFYQPRNQTPDADGHYRLMPSALPLPCPDGFFCLRDVTCFIICPPGASCLGAKPVDLGGGGGGGAATTEARPRASTRSRSRSPRSRGRPSPAAAAGRARGPREGVPRRARAAAVQGRMVL